MTMVRRLAVILAVLVAATVVTGCGGPRVGVVASTRVLKESVLALRFQAQLDEREKAMAADLRLLSGRLSAEDLEARRQSYLRDLSELKQSLEERLNERVRAVVAEVARERRLRVVLVKEAATTGGIDVTDDVIARLK